MPVAATAQETPTQAPAARPPFAPNAQEDDWGYLADPFRRTEKLDAIKYVPLGGDSYASFGGYLRAIARGYEDENFGERPGTDDTYHRRVMFNAAAVIDGRVRAFVELKHGGVEGERFVLGPVEEDELDLHQLFLEGRFGARRQHLVRVGRQELHYGRGLLVSVREGPNVRASHDGGLVRVQLDRWRVDALLTRPVTSRPEAFDDRREPGAALWALYGAGKFDGGIEVDLYYFGDRRRGRRYNSIAGDETRHTIGVRHSRKAGRWSIDAEAAAQFGQVTGVTETRTRIRAWTVYGRVERGFAGRAKPAVALEGGIASGDRRRGDRVLNTFRAPQPPGRYFGNTTPLGPANLTGLTPSVSFDLAPPTRVTLQSRFFWRVSAEDAIYSPPGFIIKRGDRSARRFVGRELGVSVNHKVDRHLTLSATIARFEAGSFLRETPPGRSVNLGEATIAYRF